MLRCALRDREQQKLKWHKQAEERPENLAGHAEDLCLCPKGNRKPPKVKQRSGGKMSKIKICILKRCIQVPCGKGIAEEATVDAR